MAFAMAAVWLLASCVAEEKNDEAAEQRRDLSFIYIEADRKVTNGVSLEDDKNWGIHNKVVAVSSEADESSEVTGIVGKVSEIFKSSTIGRTTVYGYENDDFISITFNGTPSHLPKNASYTEQIGGNEPDLLMEYFTTGTITEDMKGMFDFCAMIIYKNAKDADISSLNFWFSYDCTVNPAAFSVSGVDYIQGTFTAKMRNKDNDTFIFMNGAFSCFGF